MQSKTKEDQSNEWHFIKASEEKKKNQQGNQQSHKCPLNEVGVAR